MSKYLFSLKGLNLEEEEVLLKALQAVVEVILKPEYYDEMIK